MLGGPVVLYLSGESNAESSSFISSCHLLNSPRTLLDYIGYLYNGTLSGAIAKQQNGSAILLEHRFFGLSNPYPDLSLATFRVHTIQQAIDDVEYFAKNVKLPQANGDRVRPGQAPWVFAGGSYMGAVASYVMVK